MVAHFRSEIAGLRGVAVISVVLFHLKVVGFQGGFVGVDIFFVISGYLITRNILVDLQAGRFSFGQFYIRRTRRHLLYWWSGVPLQRFSNHSISNW